MIIELDPRKWTLPKIGKPLVVMPAEKNAPQESFMATVPTVPVPEPVAQPVVPVKGKTFLQHVGQALRKVLHIGEEAAIVAEPIIAAAFPDVTPLFQSAIGLAQAAEATAATTTGTGPQKLAQALVGINPLIDKFVTDNKLGTWASADRQKFVSAIADALNLIPSQKS